METFLILLVGAFLNVAVAQTNDPLESSGPSAETPIFDTKAFFSVIEQLPKMSINRRQNEIIRICRNENYFNLIARNFTVKLLAHDEGDDQNLNREQDLINFFILIAQSGSINSLNLLNEMYLNFDTSVQSSSFTVERKGKSVNVGEEFRQRMDLIARHAIADNKRTDLRIEAEAFEKTLLSRGRGKCEMSLTHRLTGLFFDFLLAL